MIFRDKYGWPVERTKGKHLSNFFRLLFLTNIRQTIKRRESGKDGTSCDYSIGETDQFNETEVKQFSEWYKYCPSCGAMMDADETKEEVCNKV